MTDKRKRNLALLFALLAAVGIWVAGRLTWVTAKVFDDKSGDATHKLIGAVWDPTTSPIALAIVAALILTLVVPPLLRRIMGIIVAILAATTSFRSIALLTTEVDIARAHSLLTSGAATQKQSEPNQINHWAEVVSTHVNYGPVILAVLAAAVGVLGGVLLALQPGEKETGHSRYETPESRRAGVKEELHNAPSSERVLWDALDADVDPTEDAANAADTDPKSGR